MIKRAAIAMACVVVSLQTTASFGQSSFPQRDITFIVPWNAGGSNDVAARALDPILREQGIKIVIENVVGATGVIGMRRVAGAAPDGYTLGMGTSSTLALIAQGKAPLKNADFTHIARVSTDPLMLLVSSNAPQKSLDDFIGYMKKNPDKVTIGTPGNYNLNHIFASMTARAAGVNFVNVPYTGGSKVVADLLGQHVDSGVLKPSETLGQIQEDLLKPLGVFANQRLEMFPSRTKVLTYFPTGPWCRWPMWSRRPTCPPISEPS
jgi:tripartite-type tricarboxylate transporter receptor subunit TctC